MPESYGKSVKRRREARGLEIAELARLTDVDRKTLERIETESTKPRHLTRVSIERVLGSELAEPVGKPRPQEAARYGRIPSAVGGGARVEDLLGELLAYLKTLDGKTRSDFVRGVVALFTALEHTRPAAASGSTENDGR